MHVRRIRNATTKWLHYRRVRKIKLHFEICHGSFRLNSDLALLIFADVMIRVMTGEYFKSLNFVPNSNYHNYDTRHRNQLHIGITKKAFTKKCIRHSIPALINKTPSSITEKLSSHSLNGFSHYVKNYYISEYNIVCSIDNCYICNRQ